MKIGCPFCHQHYEIDNPRPDKRFRCLYCGETFTVAEAEPLSDDTVTHSQLTPMPAAPPPARSRVNPAGETVVLDREPAAPPEEFSREKPKSRLQTVLLIAALIVLCLIGWRLLTVSTQLRHTETALASVLETLKNAEAERGQLAANQNNFEQLLGNLKRQVELKPAVTLDEFTLMRNDLKQVKETATALRSWQSKYSPSLEAVVSMLDNKTLEEIVKATNQGLNQLAKGQEKLYADFREELYSSLNLMSNEITKNLIILNNDVLQLQAHSDNVTDALNSIGGDLKSINHDIDTLFRRVNWLNRYDNTRIIISPRHDPRPVPRPPVINQLNLQAQ